MNNVAISIYDIKSFYNYMSLLPSKRKDFGFLHLFNQLSILINIDKNFEITS